MTYEHCHYSYVILPDTGGHTPIPEHANTLTLLSRHIATTLDDFHAMRIYCEYQQSVVCSRTQLTGGRQQLRHVLYEKE